MPSSGSAARIAFRNESLRLQPRQALGEPRAMALQFLGARRARPVVLGQRRDQRAQLRRGVAQQRHVGLAQALGLVGIDVEAHDLEVLVDAPAAVLDEEARADRQHGIGVLPQAMADRHVDGQPMRARDDAAAAAVGADRRLQHLGELDHLGAGIDGATADDDDRPLGRAQDLGRRGDRLVVDRFGGPRQRGIGQHHLGALGPGVEGAFQRHGPRPAGGRVPHRLAHQRRRLLRASDALGPLGDVAQEAQLVVDLVQMAVALVDVGLRDLADEADHRRVHAVGGEQRGTGIQHARARHDGEDLRLAGRESRAQRHIGGGLLVSWMNDAQTVLAA